MQRYSRCSLACHSLAALILVAFGVVYLSRSEFMPYHAAAMGSDWVSVDGGTQQVLLALMRALGGACLGVAALVGTLLWGPFRRGERWATLTIPMAGLLLCATSLYAQLGVALKTAASPPMLPVLVAGALLLVGLLMSLRHGATQRAPKPKPDE
ncbi:MAG: hypothetical protein VX259_12305 [Pseudomonadota bacterium]|nr:hypothetical protein [Pseudomonadota bacterium]